MSEQLTAFYRRSIFWWPAIMRAFLYAQITMIATFLIQAKDLTPAAHKAWDWLDWCKFWLPIASAGMGTVVAFLDSTMAKLKTKPEAE